MWREKHKELFEFERDGWFNYSEVYDLIRDIPNSENKILHAVEIGLWKGMSFSYLVHTCKDMLHWNVYGVDTFNGDPNNLREQQLISKMKDLLKDTFIRNMEEMDLKEGVDYTLIQSNSISAAAFVPKVDFLFIDGGHLEEQVRKDILTWLPKMNNGGIIAGHDYDCPGVEKVVKEFFGKNFQVINTSWVHKLG